MSEHLEREHIALMFFAATLQTTVDKANGMAFPEGARKVARDSIQAAWDIADMWIEYRDEKESSNGW